jgi:hypothetical protein
VLLLLVLLLRVPPTLVLLRDAFTISLAQLGYKSSLAVEGLHRTPRGNRLNT